MQRNEFIDVLKGSLITLVCIGHTNQFIIHQNINFWQDPLFKTIYMFHMPLFMAVAAYLSFRAITTQSATRFITRRSVTYLLPIFAWTTIEQCLKHVITGQPENILKAIAYSGVGHNLWFLWALLGSLTLMTIATATGIYRHFILFILFILVLMLPDKSIIYLFQYTFPFFIIGFYFSYFNLNRIKANHLKLITLGLCVTSFICFVYWDKETYIYVSKMNLNSANFANIVFRWFSGVVTSALFVIIVWYLYATIPSNIKKILIRSGKNSIYIYIIQTYLIRVLTRLMNHFPSPHFNVFGVVMLSIIFGILITLLCLWAGEIIAKNKYFDRILFGKLW